MSELPRRAREKAQGDTYKQRFMSIHRPEWTGARGESENDVTGFVEFLLPQVGSKAGCNEDVVDVRALMA